MSKLKSSVHCRLCRVTFDRPVGCEVCRPVKNALIFPSEDQAEHTVHELAQATARLMASQLEQLKLVLEDSHSFDAKRQRELNGLTKALTGLLAEMRKASNEQKASIARLTRAEQRDLILNEVFAVLPPADRKAWIEASEKLHQEILTPVSSVEANN